MASITATDVRAVTFDKAPFGRRGYDEEQVDAFLDEVVETLTSLETRINGLPDQPSVLAVLEQITARLDRIENSVAPRPGPPDPLLGGAQPL
ncbi:hypothetical protein GCM10009682_39550 [Luedemannella flava]|uniref:Cell wall synthesis protein Wag31 n=1 Tax=Luedemannella flava TaxID=349316 RepID=A0ABP4YKQ1_9ACTN